MSRSRCPMRRTRESRRYPRHKAAVAVRRLVQYHDYLQGLRRREGRETFSSAELAEFIRCDSSLVRRDLVAVGAAGHAGVGYSVRLVLLRLQSILGRNGLRRAVLFGAGHLGGLLMRQDWLDEAGVVLSAAFDVDPEKIGGDRNGIPILPLADAASVIEQGPARIAILAVPPEAAQSCADVAVRAGVRAIWNFAPCPLDLPASVAVRYENLVSGLTSLLYAMSVGA